MIISLVFFSLERTSLSLSASGSQTRLAMAMPMRVAMKATAMWAPSLSGSERLERTMMRPRTVPMMPIVGEKPPADSKISA